MSRISWKKEPKKESHKEAIYAFVCSLDGERIMRLRAYSWGGGIAWQWQSPLLAEFNITEHCVHAHNSEEAKHRALAHFRSLAEKKFGFLMRVLKKMEE